MIYSSQSGNYLDYITSGGNPILKASAEIMKNQNVNANQISYAINTQTCAILASQHALAETFQDGFDSVNNTLNFELGNINNNLSFGLSNVNYSLSSGFSNVNNSIQGLISGMDMHFSQLKDSIEKMSSDISKSLSAILDSTKKERTNRAYEAYDEAVKNKNKGLYEDAMDNLKIAIENKKTDFRFWHLKAELELGGFGKFANTVNVKNALESMKAAYKYFFADDENLKNKKDLAATIAYELGMTKYACSNELRSEGKIQEANDLLDEAITDYTESMQYNDKTDAEYQITRCQCLLGITDDFFAKLRDRASHDETKEYIFKVLIDPDFANLHDDIMKVLEEVRKEKCKEAANTRQEILDTCKANDFHFDANSIELKLYEELEKILCRKIYHCLIV